MIDRLIPRYPTFLILGFLVMVSALFVLTPARDAMIAIWANKLFDGDTDQTIFKTTQITDRVIGNTLSVWVFVGLGLIMLGIGAAIATIVQNLRATDRGTRDAYTSAGVAETAELEGDEPWFGRWFTRLLFIGMGIMLFALALTLWADANIVFLKRAEFAGKRLARSQRPDDRLAGHEGCWRQREAGQLLRQVAAAGGMPGAYEDRVHCRRRSKRRLAADAEVVLGVAAEAEDEDLEQRSSGDGDASLRGVDTRRTPDECVE